MGGVATYKRTWLFCVNLIPIFISLAASSWLACSFRRLPEASRRKLFPRQMRSMAIAQLVLCVAGLAVNVVQFLPLDQGDRLEFKEWGVCRVALSVLRTARTTSLLHEANVALFLMAQSTRQMSTLSILDRALPFLWAFGLVYGLINAFTHQWHYLHDKGVCVYMSIDYVSIVVLCLSFAVSTLSFGTLLVRASCGAKMPKRAAWRIFRRAAIYPLIDILSYSCVGVMYFRPSTYEHPEWLYPVAFFMEFCNGFLNVAAYRFQPKYASLRLGRAPLDDMSPLGVTQDQHNVNHGKVRSREIADFNVTFTGQDTVVQVLE